MSDSNQINVSSQTVAIDNRQTVAPRTLQNTDKARPATHVQGQSREPELSRTNTSNKVSTHSEALKALGNVKLSITIDETERLPIIKIFDDETGKELLQIPAEHSLTISRAIKAAVGAIFDAKA